MPSRLLRFERASVVAATGQSQQGWQAWGGAAASSKWSVFFCPLSFVVEPRDFKRKSGPAFGLYVSIKCIKLLPLLLPLFIPSWPIRSWEKERFDAGLMLLIERRRRRLFSSTRNEPRATSSSPKAQKAPATAAISNARRDSRDFCFITMKGGLYFFLCLLVMSASITRSFYYIQQGCCRMIIGYSKYIILVYIRLAFII